MAYGHSQSLESQFIQSPGLILVEPSTPSDAKGLLKTAIRSEDPVVFFEHKKLVLGGVEGEVPDEEYTIPFGEAVVRKEGKDATVVAFGFMVYEALNAAQELAQDGIDIEDRAGCGLNGGLDPVLILPLVDHPADGAPGRVVDSRHPAGADCDEVSLLLLAGGEEECEQ